MTLIMGFFIATPAAQRAPRPNGLHIRVRAPPASVLDD
jgi:hypothetical protein